jgi:GAF domain-containing protein
LLTYDRLIGVLDIQENKVAAFSQADLDTFNTLAGQIAIALQNATLFAECKQIEAALRESEATNRALLEAIPDAIFQLDQEGT